MKPTRSTIDRLRRQIANRRRQAHPLLGPPAPVLRAQALSAALDRRQGTLDAEGWRDFATQAQRALDDVEAVVAQAGGWPAVPEQAQAHREAALLGRLQRAAERMAAAAEGGQADEGTG